MMAGKLAKLRSIIGRLLRFGSNLLQGQKGVSLIEMVISLGILAAIGGAINYALATGHRGSGQVAEYATAEILARNQLEDIRSASYDNETPLGYPTIANIPSQYSISINVTKSGAGPAGTLQTITVTVFHEEKVVLTMNTYKTKGVE